MFFASVKRIFSPQLVKSINIKIVTILSCKTKKGLGCKNAICMQISVRKKRDFFLFEKCHLIFKFRSDYYFIVMKKTK